MNLTDSISVMSNHPKSDISSLSIVTSVAFGWIEYAMKSAGMPDLIVSRTAIIPLMSPSIPHSSFNSLRADCMGYSSEFAYPLGAPHSPACLPAASFTRRILSSFTTHAATPRSQDMGCALRVVVGCLGIIQKPTPDSTYSFFDIGFRSCIRYSYESFAPRNEGCWN